jgi:hypothetical protein
MENLALVSESEDRCRERSGRSRRGPLAAHRPVRAGCRGLEPGPLRNGGPSGPAGGPCCGGTFGTCPWTGSVGYPFGRPAASGPFGFSRGPAGPERNLRAA